MQTKRKTMIVTGAGQGIGAAVTNAFIERGYNVLGNALNITASTFGATDNLAVVSGDIGGLESCGVVRLRRGCRRARGCPGRCASLRDALRASLTAACARRLWIPQVGTTGWPS